MSAQCLARDAPKHGRSDPANKTRDGQRQAIQGTQQSVSVVLEGCTGLRRDGCSPVPGPVVPRPNRLSKLCARHPQPSSYYFD